MLPFPIHFAMLFQNWKDSENLSIDRTKKNQSDLALATKFRNKVPSALLEEKHGKHMVYTTRCRHMIWPQFCATGHMIQHMAPHMVKPRTYGPTYGPHQKKIWSNL